MGLATFQVLVLGVKVHQKSGVLMGIENGDVCELSGKRTGFVRYKGKYSENDGLFHLYEVLDGGRWRRYLGFASLNAAVDGTKCKNGKTIREKDAIYFNENIGHFRLLKGDFNQMPDVRDRVKARAAAARNSGTIGEYK